MRSVALAAFLRPGEDSVADAERTATAAFDHAKPRRRTFGVPLLRNREDIAALIRIDDPKHGNFRHSARFVERSARSAVDQPLVRHILEQGLEQYLVLTRQAERACDLALAGRLVGCRDEVQDLLSAG
jgi:hypothetical protein